MQQPPCKSAFDSSCVLREDDEYVIHEHAHSDKGSPIQELFGEGQTGITLLAWLAMFGNQFLLFAMVLWMPTLFTQGGLAEKTALFILALYNVGGVIGGWAFSIFADKYDPARVLTFTYPLAGISVALLGISLGSVPILVTVAIVTGFFVESVLVPCREAAEVRRCARQYSWCMASASRHRSADSEAAPTFGACIAGGLLC